MPRIASPYSAIDNADVIIETIDNRECFYLQKIAWFDKTLRWEYRVMTLAYVKRYITSNGWLRAAAYADPSFRRSNVDWRYLAAHYAQDLTDYNTYKTFHDLADRLAAHLTPHKEYHK